MGKAAADAIQFVNQIGGKTLNYFVYRDDTEDADQRRIRFDGMLGGLKWDDIVIIHYPILMFDKATQRQFIAQVHNRGARVVTHIDDVKQWQINGDYDQPFDEPFLTDSDGIIAQTPKMAAQLRQQLNLADNQAMVVRGPGGYVTSLYDQKDRTLGTPIDYAGGLHKAPFLAELATQVPVNIYANVDDGAPVPEGINVKGTYDPDVIPHIIDGSFGLVWDSESYTDVTGKFAEYTRYNTPSKLSLYLSANEPVIVWSGAGVANFVRENHVGLVIDSLTDLAPRLAALTPEEYHAILSNTHRIGNVIRSGYFLKQAVFKMQGELLLAHAEFN
ncbi:hypothetical protein [Levilactobacillus bambusae]|uniref:Beta-1,6-galactofuranosyltransferase n=1 Tax=Levilactobacillus bambusae TaxID=2024736 RepID=A0A2V1MZ84_9LACO|nr:hypothetical protein [Levilactobacillus bambusae]PWG00324.1 hypothetical protein DCM90_05180 [Levilactobacillus bambusae]